MNKNEVLQVNSAVTAAPIAAMAETINQSKKKLCARCGSRKSDKTANELVDRMGLRGYYQRRNTTDACRVAWEKEEERFEDGESYCFDCVVEGVKAINKRNENLALLRIERVLDGLRHEINNGNAIKVPSLGAEWRDGESAGAFGVLASALFLLEGNMHRKSFLEPSHGPFDVNWKYVAFRQENFASETMKKEDAFLTPKAALRKIQRAA